MKIKNTSLQALTAITLMTFTHSAFALSCMKPDPIRQCKQMQAEKLSPVLANGTLTLKKIISQETKEMNIGGKGPAVAEYHFTGSVSDEAGKREVKNTKILISTSCAGPWCAKLPTSKTSGYFLLKTEPKSVLKLHLGACSFQPFTVTEQQVKNLETCVTPKPVKKPELVNNGSSQIYTQRHKKQLKKLEIRFGQKLLQEKN